MILALESREAITIRRLSRFAGTRNSKPATHLMHLPLSWKTCVSRVLACNKTKPINQSTSQRSRFAGARNSKPAAYLMHLLPLSFFSLNDKGHNQMKARVLRTHSRTSVCHTTTTTFRPTC